MNNYQQRRLNTYQAELAFMRDNTADFPNNSVGAKTVVALTEIINEIQNLAGEQRSNVTRQHTSIKSDRLQQLIDILQKMNRAAIAMADEIDGIENLFRMPRRRSHEVWIATARTFHKDSANYEAEFLEYDLAETFRADLLAVINEFQNASDAVDSAGSQRAGATGGLTDAFKRAGVLSNKLNAIVLNKYSNNAQKLASWAVASHVESASKTIQVEENTNS